MEDMYMEDTNEEKLKVGDDEDIIINEEEDGDEYE